MDTIVLDANVTNTPAERLDVTRLQDAVLAPLLGIGDVRTDKRIDFVGGREGKRRSWSRGSVPARRPLRFRYIRSTCRI